MAVDASKVQAQLVEAVRAGNLKAVRAALRRGARPDVGPWVPIREAVIYDSTPKLLACLIEADPNQQVLDNALEVASQFRRGEMVRALLNAGARVTFDPNSQWSAGGDPPDSVAYQETRRLLVSHRTAGRLQTAMGGVQRKDEEPQERRNPSGPSPL